jgi:hypothetical protein
MIKVLIIVWGCVCFAPQALATDTYHILGAGADSCGAWSAQKGTALGNLNNMWILGFVTAVNRYALMIDDNVARGTNAEGLFAWVDNYCRAHPLDNIATATDNLIGELQRRSGAR